jgi:hypothetical protein
VYRRLDAKPQESDAAHPQSRELPQSQSYSPCLVRRRGAADRLVGSYEAQFLQAADVETMAEDSAGVPCSPLPASNCLAQILPEMERILTLAIVVAGHRRQAEQNSVAACCFQMVALAVGPANDFPGCDDFHVCDSGCSRRIIPFVASSQRVLSMSETLQLSLRRVAAKPAKPAKRPLAGNEQSRVTSVLLVLKHHPVYEIDQCLHQIPG